MNFELARILAALFQRTRCYSMSDYRHCDVAIEKDANPNPIITEKIRFFSQSNRKDFHHVLEVLSRDNDGVDRHSTRLHVTIFLMLNALIIHLASHCWIARRCLVASSPVVAFQAGIHRGDYLSHTVSRDVPTRLIGCSFIFVSACSCGCRCTIFGSTNISIIP